MAAPTFIQIANKRGWSYGPNHLEIDVSDLDEVLDKFALHLAANACATGKEFLLRWGERTLAIPPALGQLLRADPGLLRSMAESSESDREPGKLGRATNAPNPQLPGKGAISPDASAVEVGRFMLECRENGLSVSATSMVNDCVLTYPDNLPRERSIILPYQYIGMNLRLFWKDSWDFYTYLVDRLHAEGWCDRYQYPLKQVNQTWAHYEACYYLIKDYLGTPVRLSVSIPGAWTPVEQPMIFRLQF